MVVQCAICWLGGESCNYSRKENHNQTIIHVKAPKWLQLTLAFFVYTPVKVLQIGDWLVGNCNVITWVWNNEYISIYVYII